jgi:hypothetical protein
MVNPIPCCVSALFVLAASSPLNASPIDLAHWAAALPTRFSVHGVKTEPTYQEVVDIRREGDLFTLVGGAPGWAERSQESVAVSRDGALRYTFCPKGMSCREAPTGFLATATLLAAFRRGQLQGHATTATFGGREIVCVPAERIGIALPLFDPCFDLATGATLAQRHRLTGQFDGPSLEPTSLRVASYN